MKKLNFIQLLIVNYIIAVPILWLFFYYLPRVILNDKTYPLDVIVSFKMSIFMSLMYSLLYTIMTIRIRKSKKFWEQAELVREKLKDIKSSEELEMLYSTEYQMLLNLWQGVAHTTEIKIIGAIIETKRDYLNGK